MNCLDFCAIFFSKIAEITVYISPQFLCQNALDFCAKTFTKSYCTDCIKCSRTALENVPKTQPVPWETCQISSSKSVPDIFWKNVPKLSWKTVLKPYCTAAINAPYISSKNEPAINEVVLHLNLCAQ